MSERELLEVVSKRVRQDRKNLDRVEAIVKLARQLRQGPWDRIDAPDQRSLSKSDDLLRAATVFLHATLEHFCREVWRYVLAKSTKRDDFKGLRFTDEKERISLSDLVPHRGKSVDQILAESIDHFLETKSFNNTNELAGFLDTLNLPRHEESDSQQDPRGHLSILSSMMQRRHNIVHQADWKSDQTLQDISVDDVAKWADATKNFIVTVSVRLAISPSPETAS